MSATRNDLAPVADDTPRPYWIDVQFHSTGQRRRLRYPTDESRHLAKILLAGYMTPIEQGRDEQPGEEEVGL